MSDNRDTSKTILEKVEKEIAHRNAAKLSACEAPSVGYRVGELLKFGTETELCVRKLIGFSHPEEHHIWSLGKHSSIDLLMKAPILQPHILRLNFAPFLGPGLPSQTVQLGINGRMIAKWEATREGDYFAMVPASKEQSIRSIAVDIYTPNSRSPHDIGMSGDERKLGIALRELSIQALI